MYSILDMGTTNTRLYLCEENKIVQEIKGEFGASYGKKHGRECLGERFKALLDELLSKCGLEACELENIVAVGMAGSEIGLCDTPHIPLPVDAHILSENVRVEKLPEIDAPFLFIPGVKKTNGDKLLDMMRGEECEAIGIATAISLDEDALFILPGTHNKIVEINKDGKVTDLRTTFSGELLDSVVSNTILAGEVTHDFQIVEPFLLKGALYAKENGINAALFQIRVMAKNGVGTHELSSFLYGSVISEDVSLIKRLAAGKKIYVGGRKNLREAYALLLGEENAFALDDEICSSAMIRGAMLIRKIYGALSRRAAVISQIEKKKVIAIIRDAEAETCIDAAEALYEGGIRLAEVTFDRSGKKSTQETAAIIRMLAEKFGEKMYIGAGTVTRIDEVFAAFDAGAVYVISPNCDSEIISLTRKLGMVSIPAAYTGSEIAAAMNCGADYVKLFPAHGVSAEYVKAICAPLSDAKLLAVGGVNAENASQFFKMGFHGIGVGSNLYDKKLIREKKFDELRELARKYSSLV